MKEVIRILPFFPSFSPYDFFILICHPILMKKTSMHVDWFSLKVTESSSVLNQGWSERREQVNPHPLKLIHSI